MKYLFYSLCIGIILYSCNTSKTTVTQKKDTVLNTKENDTVRIANNKLEYEIIIIEPGFNAWLLSTARPEGYYSQQFLENRNIFYTIEWNQRVIQPQRFNPNLYQLQIDYRNGIDYGYEVNYKLYNYFIYFQLQYNQRLGPFIPRI